MNGGTPIPLSVPLGRTQKLVLSLLAGHSKSIRTLAADWPGLTESSVRSSLTRLARRALVDVAGFDDYERRTYCLTSRGAEVEASLNLDLDGDE